MTEREIKNVLFLCTGNSARSVMAECILNRLGRGRFHAYSAGSYPAQAINPYAHALLEHLNYDVSGMRPKDWSEFAEEGAPVMDFVFTVCDRAAGEVCPVWPGQPMTAHWSFPDPAAFQGTDPEVRAFFASVYGQLYNRIAILVSLPMASLDKLSLQRRLDELGKGAHDDVAEDVARRTEPPRLTEASGSGR